MSAPTSASLIGHSGSSAFRLSTATVSTSLAGSCFSSESAPGGPSIMGFEDKVEQSFGRPYRQSDDRVQADMRSHLIHRPARDIIPPLGGARLSSYDPARPLRRHSFSGPFKFSAVNPDE